MSITRLLDVMRDQNGKGALKMAIVCFILPAIVLSNPNLTPMEMLSKGVDALRSHLPASINTITQTLDHG